jgi:hypothetical protein
MGRTAQVLAVGSIVWLLASSVVIAVAAPAPVVPDRATGRSSTLVSASPAVFAERVTAAHQSGSGRWLEPWQGAMTVIELIVLAGLCATGAAAYSAASADRDGAAASPRLRRR